MMSFIVWHTSQSVSPGPRDVMDTMTVQTGQTKVIVRPPPVHHTSSDVTMGSVYILHGSVMAVEIAMVGKMKGTVIQLQVRVLYR